MDGCAVMEGWGEDGGVGMGVWGGVFRGGGGEGGEVWNVGK